MMCKTKSWRNIWGIPVQRPFSACAGPSQAWVECEVRKRSSGWHTVVERQCSWLPNGRKNLSELLQSMVALEAWEQVEKPCGWYHTLLSQSKTASLTCTAEWHCNSFLYLLWNNIIVETQINKDLVLDEQLRKSLDIPVQWSLQERPKPTCASDQVERPLEGPQDYLLTSANSQLNIVRYLSTFLDAK